MNPYAWSAIADTIPAELKAEKEQRYWAVGKKKFNPDFW